MAWTSMHFAVGMCGGAVLTLAPCLILRRGWRFIPVGMTLGGLWGLAPDLPRLWREDFPSLPFAATLGSKDLELWFHSIGDLFFLHRTLDAQPREFALLGLAMIIALYNVSLIGMLWGRRSDRRKYAGGSDQRSEVRSAAQTPMPRTDAPAEHPGVNIDHPAVIGRISGDKSA